jgi:membrane-associated protease RseP (regulator of RpoE activity)
MSGVIGAAAWVVVAWMGVQDAAAQSSAGQLVLAGGETILFPAEAEALFGRGYLGIEMLDLNAELRVYYGGRGDVGVLVAGVEAGSPAAKAGLRVGDLIVAVDGEPSSATSDVLRAVRPRAAGDRLRLDVVRERQPIALTASLVERERQPVVVQGPVFGWGEENALVVQDAFARACGGFSDPGIVFGADAGRQAELAAMAARMQELEAKLAQMERLLAEMP